MSADLTPRQVRDELRRLARKLEQRTNDFVRLASEAAEADHAYKVAFAKAMYQACGSSAKDRESEALLACEEEHHAAKAKAAEADACREQVRSLRDQLTAVEAAGASLRSEMELSGRDWRAA